MVSPMDSLKAVQIGQGVCFRIGGNHGIPDKPVSGKKQKNQNIWKPLDQKIFKVVFQGRLRRLK